MKDRYELAALAQGFAVEALLDLIADLTDPTECRYDHDDACQAHSLDPRPCPHERANRLLAKRADAEGAVS